jgi:hypothetical protein
MLSGWVCRRISGLCCLSLAPGFSPVFAGAVASSRFNGLVFCPAEKRLKPFPASAARTTRLKPGANESWRMCKKLRCAAAAREGGCARPPVELDHSPSCLLYRHAPDPGRRAGLASPQGCSEREEGNWARTRFGRSADGSRPQRAVGVTLRVSPVRGSCHALRAWDRSRSGNFPTPRARGGPVVVYTSDGGWRFIGGHRTRRSMRLCRASRAWAVARPGA